MRPGSVEWTLEEEAKLRRLVGEGKTAREAGEALRRPTEGVRAKGERMGLTFASGLGRTQPLRSPVKSDEPPPGAPPRYSSLTALMFGDPPVGRSALDQKRAGQ